MEFTLPTNRANQKPLPSIPVPAIRLPTDVPQDDLDSLFQTNSQLSASFYRIQHRLVQDSVTSDPIIYLLRCDSEIFQHYQYLVSRREPVWVHPGGRSLNLALTADLWNDLSHCVASYEIRLLSNSLSAWIGANHWLLQRESVPDGNAGHSQPAPAGSICTRTSSGGSSSLKRKLSNTSSRSDRSRRPSVTTIDTGELLSASEPRVTKPVPEYICPLVAQGHCKGNPYVKLGNCKNHVEREHRWYTDSHRDWSKEILVSTRLSGHEVNRNIPPSPRPCDSTDMNLAYVGTGSSVNPLGASPGACVTFGFDLPSNQPGQSTALQNLPQTSNGLNMAEATRFSLESDSTFLDESFCNDPGMTGDQGNNSLRAPLPSRIYTGTRQYLNEAQRRASSQAPPSPVPPRGPYG